MRQAGTREGLREGPADLEQAGARCPEPQASFPLSPGAQPLLSWAGGLRREGSAQLPPTGWVGPVSDQMGSVLAHGACHEPSDQGKVVKKADEGQVLMM